MISICKRFKFEAAHQLKYYNGVCKNVHGHSYLLDVEITGPINPALTSSHGMILDFHTLKAIVCDAVIDKLDHSFLNDSLPKGVYPTAENMVCFIADVLNIRFSSPYELKRVRLYETADAYAEWTRGGNAS